MIKIVARIGSSLTATSIDFRLQIHIG